jgi:platelet-activating factor acetylhydrolase IB subunit alpha
MVLTDDERCALHTAMVEYCSQHDMANAAKALEADIAARDSTFGDKAGALERRWNTLRRLSLANSQLEARNKQLEQELAEVQDPTKRHINSKETIPLEPARHQFVGHRDTVTAVALHPFEGVMFSTSEDGTMRTWDLESRQPLHVARMSESVTCVAVEPTEGKRTACGCADQTVRLHESAECVMTLLGHDDAVTAVVWIGDVSKNLVSAARDGEIRVWDTVRGSQTAVMRCDSWVRCLAVNGCGSASPTLAVGCNDETVQLWALSSRQRLTTVGGHNNVVQAVAFSNSATDAVLIASHGTAADKTKLKSSHTDDVPAGSTSTYRAEGLFVASAGRGKDVHINNVATGAELFKVTVHDNWVRQLSFTVSGKHLISCADDSTVRVFDLATKRQVRCITAHEHFVTCLAMHPLGAPLMVTGSADNSIKMWSCS